MRFLAAATEATSAELIRIKDDRDLTPPSSSPPRFCIMPRRGQRAGDKIDGGVGSSDLPHKARRSGSLLAALIGR